MKSISRFPRPAPCRRAPQGARGLKFLWYFRAGRQSPRSRPARGAWVEITMACTSIRRGTWSRPARGAWVEIYYWIDSMANASCRAPQGARGLKYIVVLSSVLRQSRAPQGARGLKYFDPVENFRHNERRAPQGARGLKYKHQVQLPRRRPSRAPQGARGLKS